MYLHRPLAVEGEVAAALFKSVPQSATSVAECPAVCLERGVDYDLVPYPITQKYYDPNDPEKEHSDFLSFIGSHSCGRVEIAIINYSPKTLDLYWVNGDQENFLYKLQRMEANTRFIHTFNTHRFRAKDPDSGEVWMDTVVEFSGTIGIGNHVNPHRERDIRDIVRRTMGGEWAKKQQVKRTFR